MPSIERLTEVTPLAVHFSSISVGALHSTGEGGLIVKFVNTTGAATVEVVAALPTVLVVAGSTGVRVVLVDEEIDEEADEEVDDVGVGGSLAFFPLLQAPRATIAANEARTRPMRATNGGYGDEPPYPGH